MVDQNLFISSATFLSICCYNYCFLFIYICIFQLAISLTITYMYPNAFIFLGDVLLFVRFFIFFCLQPIGCWHSHVHVLAGTLFFLFVMIKSDLLTWWNVKCVFQSSRVSYNFYFLVQLLICTETICLHY